MIDRNSGPVQSKLHIAGHPLHPMVVPFPIASIIGAAVTDTVYSVTGDGMWANFSFWLLWTGVATGVVAALGGLVDFIGIQRVRNLTWGWVHFLGNATAVVLTAINAVMRIPDPAITGATQTTGLILSVVAAGVIVVTGWAGAEMVYRHRIGVIPGTRAAAEAREEPPTDIRRVA